jgi:hypothetical protein
LEEGQSGGQDQTVARATGSLPCRPAGTRSACAKISTTVWHGLFRSLPRLRVGKPKGVFLSSHGPANGLGARVHPGRGRSAVFHYPLPHTIRIMTAL